MRANVAGHYSAGKISVLQLVSFHHKLTSERQLRDTIDRAGYYDLNKIPQHRLQFSIQKAEASPECLQMIWVVELKSEHQNQQLE